MPSGGGCARRRWRRSSRVRTFAAGWPRAIREGEVKAAALPRRRLRPGPPAAPLGHLVDNGQAEVGPRVRLLAVENRQPVALALLAGRAGRARSARSWCALLAGAAQRRMRKGRRCPITGVRRPCLPARSDSYIIDWLQGPCREGWIEATHDEIEATAPAAPHPVIKARGRSRCRCLTDERIDRS